jgi:hypothetical protein
MQKLNLNPTAAVLTAGALAALILAVPGLARAQGGGDLSHIHVTYHGGALMQHVKVFPLYWGKEWSGAKLTGYFNSFFPALFADGRYMANLAQYSAGGYQIGKGEFGAAATDPVAPPATVTDAQIQDEIRSQIAAGKLSQPGADTLYVVFTPPHVLVVDSQGEDSEHNFLGYHDYASDGQFSYAVIAYNEGDQVWYDARLMTVVISHELAEAVTDPDPQLQERRQGGWYDEKNGEIGDIPAALFVTGRIEAKQFGPVLTAADGTRYVWCRRSGATGTMRRSPSPSKGSSQ